MDKTKLTLFSTCKALCQNAKTEPFNVSTDESENPIQFKYKICFDSTAEMKRQT